MGIKISEYVNTVTSLSASDLTDVSKLISTSPDVWQTQKLPYSVLLTELAADLNFVEGSGTINYIPKFSGAGTVADGIMQDDGATISLGGALDATMKLRMYADKPFGLYVDNTAASGSQHISLYGKSIAANTASNTGFYGEALGSTGGTNLGARGKAADTTIQDSAVDILYAGANTGGFFQANKSGAYTSYGLVGSADSTSSQGASTHVGGFFRAINAGTKYSVRLVDDSEGIGKFLKSIDANGNANWATVNDYTADASPDTAADYFLVWDTSASLHKKVLMSNVPASAVTLYNTDSTFSAARTAKLSGNTSSEYLAFQTLAGNNLLKVRGDGKFAFGTSTDPTGSFAATFGDSLRNFGAKWYLDNADNTGGRVQYIANGYAFIEVDGYSQALHLNTSGSSNAISLNPNSTRITTTHADESYTAFRAIYEGIEKITLSSYGHGGRLALADNVGNTDVWLGRSGYYNYVYGNFAIGARVQATYKLEVHGSSYCNGIVHNVKGANIASANDLTLTTNSHTITGTTTINAITISPFIAGDNITLVFSGATTVKHNTAGGGGTAVMKLSGSVDLTTAADTVLCLYYDGTLFQETSRKLA